MSELRNNFRNITTLEFPVMKDGIPLSERDNFRVSQQDFNVLTLGLSALKDFSIATADS